MTIDFGRDRLTICFRSECAYFEECGMFNAYECGQYVSLDEYIEKNRQAYLEDFESYLKEFENG